MAATGARIEAYSYSDSSTRWVSTNRIGVDLGAGTVYVRHTAPALLEDQLATWATLLDAAAPAGAPWSLTYSSTTRRVTIARTGAGNITLALPGSVGMWLGFTAASYTGATSYTGGEAPAGLVQAESLDVQIGEMVERSEMAEYRHGRAIATTWGRMDRFKVRVYIRRDRYPWQATTSQTDDDTRGGWVLTGRVRLHQSDGDASAYSAVRYAGYVDGFIAECSADFHREDDGRIALDLVVIRPDVDPGVAEPTGFWGAVRYGWNPVYCLTISGIPVVWCERETGKTLASGYTESAALVIDDSAAVGSIIDRDRGIGIGLSLGYKLLDTSALSPYMTRPTATTYLTADLTATAATPLAVKSTAAFAAAGTIWLAGERITYTGKTATTFTGITRGTAGSRQTGHRKASAAVVTDTFRWWQGQDVRLSALPADPSGYVTGAALADDEVEVWRGRIEDAPLRSMDGWAFSATALDRVLEKPLGAKVTGHVVGYESAVVVSVAWSAYLRIDGMDAAGASVWAAGPYEVKLTPFAALTDGDVISAGQARGLIDAAWSAAITALGAGADLSTSLQWVAIKAAGTIGWHCNPIVKANAAVVYVSVFASDWGGAPVLGLPKFPPKQPAATWDWAAFVGWEVGPDPTSLGLESFATAPIVIQLDEGTTADVPASGFIRVTSGSTKRLFSYAGAAGATGDTSLLYIPGTTPADNGEHWGYAAKMDKASVEIWFSDGPKDPTVLMLDALESSGGALFGTYDVQAQSCGYAIDDGQIDEASFLGAAGALGPQTTVSGAGTSFAALYGGLLALCRMAVVQRNSVSSSSLAVRLACVETAADGSDWTRSLTDHHLLHLADEPVESVTRLNPPNAIKVTRIIAAGGGESETVEAVYAAGVQQRGRQQADWSVIGNSRAELAELVQARAMQHFAAEQDAQAVVLRVPPWVDAQPGDLLYLDTLTHPSLWDYGAGASGYDGFARVTGRAMNLRDCTVELTLLLAGQFRATGLSPSALVVAHAGAAGAPTSIDVPVKYLPHFSTALSQAGGNIEILHYHPGNGEGTGQRYTISAATETGGVCRLTIAAQTGVFSLDASSRVTLPPTGLFGATSYQDGFAHIDDGTRWV